jgi:hypothetical protein
MKKEKERKMYLSKLPKNIKIKKKIPYNYRRKGLFGDIRELLNFDIIDNILQYSYKYERIDFYRSIMHRTFKDMFKITFKIIHAQYDFVYNDLKVNYFNGLKNISTQNTRLFRIFTMVQNARPLNRIALYGKQCLNYLPKFKEFYNFTGSTNNYHVIQFFVDKLRNDLNSANIFRYLNDVKIDIVMLIINSNKKISMLKSSFFNYNRFTKNARIIVSGLNFIVKKRNYYTRKKRNSLGEVIKQFRIITRKKRKKRRRSFIIPFLNRLFNKFTIKFLTKKQYKFKYKRKLLMPEFSSTIINFKSDPDAYKSIWLLHKNTIKNVK